MTGQQQRDGSGRTSFATCLHSTRPTTYRFETRPTVTWHLRPLVPNATGGPTYLYREVDDVPIAWWDPLELVSEVEAWLVPAAGNAMCVDQLIGFVSVLGSDDQVR